MVIIDDTAVRANRHVDSGFSEISIAGPGNLEHSRGLATADAFLFTGDADRTAADTDFDKIGTRLDQVAKAFFVDDIAGAYFDLRIVLLDPLQGLSLVFGESVRRVDDQDIGACLDQGWNAFGIVAGIDAGADHQAFLAIEQFIRVFLVVVVVLAENHADHAPILREDRQLVDLVVPDDVVGFTQGDAFLAGHEVVQGRHERADRGIGRGTGHAIVAAGDNTDQAAIGSAIIGHSHGRMAGASFDHEYV